MRASLLARATASTQEALSLPHGDAMLQQEGTDLIDDRRAPADQSLTHTVQRLQIELIGGLGGDELHRWSLHRIYPASSDKKGPHTATNRQVRGRQVQALSETAAVVS